MKRKTTSYAVERMTKAMAVVVDAATKKLQKIADDYRDDVVLPVCSKYELEYMAGNGGWSFYLNSSTPTSFTTISSVDDIDMIGVNELFSRVDDEEAAQKKRDAIIKDMHADLDVVIECLGIEGIGRYDCLGLYVADVKAKDWRKP